MRVFLDGVIQRANDVLTFRVGRYVCQVFRKSLSGDRHTGAVQHSRLQHGLHQRLNATDLNQFGHQIFSAGFEVRQHGNVLAEPGKVIQFQLHSDRVRHSQQVQHGIG